MTPSFHSPSRYLHLCTPSRTLGPASGEVGELVARPPFMWASLAVTDFLMLQVVSPSFTNKTLGSPSTFLNTGRPLLHFPSSNLSKIYQLVFIEIGNLTEKSYQPIITEAFSLLFHHRAFPSHSDDLAGCRKSGILQGERNIAVLPAIVLVPKLPLIRWW